MRATPILLKHSKARGYQPLSATGTRVRLEPRVVPIYWDTHFKSQPSDVTVFDEFLRTLFRSSWMTELGRQGVAPARLLPSFVPRRVPNVRLGRLDPADPVREWEASGQVTPLPQSAELFHLIVAPSPPKAALPVTLDRWVMVPLVAAGPRLLELHSLALSRALAGAFLRAARAASGGASLALVRTS
jgi:hypothetical protein